MDPCTESVTGMTKFIENSSKKIPNCCHCSTNVEILQMALVYHRIDTGHMTEPFKWIDRFKWPYSLHPNSNIMWIYSGNWNGLPKEIFSLIIMHMWYRYTCRQWPGAQHPAHNYYYPNVQYSWFYLLDQMIYSIEWIVLYNFQRLTDQPIWWRRKKIEATYNRNVKEKEKFEMSNVTAQYPPSMPMTMSKAIKLKKRLKKKSEEQNDFESNWEK